MKEPNKVSPFSPNSPQMLSPKITAKISNARPNIPIGMKVVTL